ncbi:N-acyl-D-amino-acid deacylase family protein [Agromyces silvae]|uniref:N-acyl-D-amino-acid deacylase family protein n=1 Tax=Agromyces silvae TaxID=3388266 RepID=UPI00280AEDB0|nr:amidohydrolase family protein [Agromyces protaetiae]
MSVTVLRGGRVVDGLGGEPTAQDVVIEGPRIARLLEPGRLAPAELGPEVRVVDVSGRIVAPGFVDVHTHSDLSVLAYPDNESRITQGVTTEVVGNCGMLPAPVVDEPALRAAIGPVDVVPGVAWSWSGIGDLLDHYHRTPRSTHLTALAGHGALRLAVAPRAGALTPAETARLGAAVDSALDDGCAGVSLGLMYAPGERASKDELTAVARAVAGRGRLLAVHLAAYDTDGLEAAVRSMLRVAERTGVRLQLSHLRLIGADQGTYERVLELVEHARAVVDVEADVYPYLSGHTTLLQLLPSSVRANGVPAALAMESDRPGALATALARCRFAPDAITIMKAPRTPDVVGANAGSFDAPWERLAQLILENAGDVDVAVVGSTADSLAVALRTPWISIASDGAALSSAHRSSAAHPRSWGTFPRAYRLMRDLGVPIGEVIRRMTHAPAQRVGSRATVTEGARADLVVFDDAELRDTSTFSAPLSPALGVEHVFVSGDAVLEDGQPTGRRPGTLLSERNAS